MDNIKHVEDLLNNAFIQYTKDKLYFLDINNIFHSARLIKIDLLRSFTNDEYSIRILFKSTLGKPLMGGLKVSRVDVLYGADLIGILLGLFDDYFPVALDPNIYYI